MKYYRLEHTESLVEDKPLLNKSTDWQCERETRIECAVRRPIVTKQKFTDKRLTSEIDQKEPVAAQTASHKPDLQIAPKRPADSGALPAVRTINGARYITKGHRLELTTLYRLVLQHAA